MNAMLKYITIICALTMLVSFCAIANAEIEDNNVAEENKVYDEANDMNPAPWDHIVSVVAGNGFTVGLRSDGRVAYAGDNNSEDIQKIAGWREISKIEVFDRYDISYIVGYEKDGGIRLTSVFGGYDTKDRFSDRRWTENDFATWKSVVQLIIDDDICAGLRNDGTVVATGKRLSEMDIMNVSEWRDVIQIIDYPCLIGVKSDGKIECTDWAQLVDWGWGLDEEWEEIEQIQFGCFPDSSLMPIGIKKDGTLLGLNIDGAKSSSPRESCFEPELAEWINILDLYCSEYATYDATYALRSDGRICLYTSYPLLESGSFGSRFEPTTWTDVVQFDYSSYYPAALRKDGTVVTVTESESGRNTAGWKDVKKIVGCNSLLIGLKKDGTVLVTGDPQVKAEKQIISEIQSWTNVKDIFSPERWPYDGHIVAIRNDGTVVAAGDNSMGQCDFTYPTPHNEEKASENTVEPADPEEEEKNTGERQVLREGTCGSNLSWFLDEEGQLTISGDGSMEDYSKNGWGKTPTPPWEPLRSQIKTIRIEGANTIGSYAFYGCTNLSQIILSGSVEIIKSCAFMECTGLTEISLSPNLEKIESEAFRHCVKLKEIWFPETLESIDRMAFQGCEKLKRVVMTGDTELEYWYGYCDVFEGCVSLTSAGPIGSGCDFEFAWTDAIGGFPNCRNLAKVILPETVTVIPDRAFYGCESLENIHIPDGVTEIGAGAFAKCTNLTDLRLPQSVTVIGEYAFYNCLGLKEIQIPAATNEIGTGTFMSCRSLEKVFLPEHMEKMWPQAFRDCISLSEIVIPEGISYIHSFTFKGCTSLQKVTLPASLESLDETAFMDCSGLQYVISCGWMKWEKYIDYPAISDFAKERCGYFDAAEKIFLPADDLENGVAA